jgi:hypothetical protein
MARKDHELADEVALERALNSLDKRDSDDGLAECNARLDAEIRAQHARCIFGSCWTTGLPAT